MRMLNVFFAGLLLATAFTVVPFAAGSLSAGTKGTHVDRDVVAYRGGHGFYRGGGGHNFYRYERGYSNGPLFIAPYSNGYYYNDPYYYNDYPYQNDNGVYLQFGF